MKRSVFSFPLTALIAAPVQAADLPTTYDAASAYTGFLMYHCPPSIAECAMFTIFVPNWSVEFFSCRRVRERVVRCRFSLARSFVREDRHCTANFVVRVEDGQLV